MPITANALPAIPPTFTVPFDAALDLSNGSQTLAATGYMGTPNTVDIGQGRLTAIWAIDITNIDLSSADETYRFFLMGSNDAAWGNGNVELLAFHDFAAVTAGRIVPTIMGPTPTPIPPVGMAGTLVFLPFSNLMQRIVHRYVRGYVVIAGTTPTVTFRSWVAPVEMKL